MAEEAECPEGVDLRESSLQCFSSGRTLKKFSIVISSSHNRSKCFLHALAK